MDEKSEIYKVALQRIFINRDSYDASGIAILSIL